MKYSIKQIMRSPIRFMMLIISMMIASALFVYSVSLFITSNMQLQQLKNSYYTMGTIQQNKSTTKVESIYDAALKTNTYFKYPVYDSYIPKEVLDLNSYPYLVSPEKRQYYGAYVKDKTTYNEANSITAFYELISIIEFTPVRDCTPNEPVPVIVSDVLLGNQTLKNREILFCDHHTETPTSLKVGTHYIATVMSQNNMHNPTSNEEWYPTKMLPYTTQCNINGELLDQHINEMLGLSWEEVSDDFYEKGRGVYWKNMIVSYQMLEKTIPVLPTHNIEMLPSFHTKDAYIVEGDEINKKDFEEGNRVCLIPKQFAQTNQLSIGDKLSLPLYFANYAEPSSVTFGQGAGLNYSLLNKDGDLYEIFSNHEYEIVGIYDYQNHHGYEMAGSTEIAFDLVIIPANAIQESDENNIVSVGPMLHTTTSFLIQNGSMDEYISAFEKLNQKNQLTLTLDDNGYEQMKTELSENKTSAILFGVIGVFSMFSIMMVILYFYIVKEKKRIAIERSLGMSKKQCKISSLSGLMLYIGISTLIGGLISGILVVMQMRTLNQTNVYDLTFSIKTMEISHTLLDTQMIVIICIISIMLPVFILGVMFILSNYMMNHLMNGSILKMLGSKET